MHQAQTLTIACGNGRFLTGCLSSAPVPEALRGEFLIFQKKESVPPAAQAQTEPVIQTQSTTEPERFRQPQAMPEPVPVRQSQAMTEPEPIRQPETTPQPETLEMNGEKQQFLGIPGIYEQPERMMAMLFGFPEFEAAAAVSSDSKDMTGVFGYWMCPLNQD